MIKKILIAASATSLMLASYAATPKDTLVMAKRFDDIVSLDPAEVFEVSGGEITGNVYDRLVAYDLDNIANIHGKIAESWTVSDDGKVLTFKIKPNLKFSSGNPITAHDVEYSFHRAIKMAKVSVFILSQFGFTPENVAETVKALDDNTVQFTLNDNYATSFVLYCFTASIASIVDSKIVEANAKDGDYGNAWLKNHSAGSGPYALEIWQPNKVITLKKNPNNTLQPAKLDKVVISHIGEAAVQRVMLEKGDIDIARDLQNEQVNGVKDNADINLTVAPLGTVYYLGMNQKNEILKNLKVQEALRYLVNYEALSENILGINGIEQQYFIPQGVFSQLTDKPYQFDLAKGKALLKEAGYENGFKMSLLVRDASERVEMTKLMQKNFSDAGIEVELKVATGKQALTVYRAREHELTLQGWGIDYQDPNTNASTFVHNPDNSDESKISTLAWRNSWAVPQALSDKVEAAKRENDIAKRETLYQEIQQAFLKQAPMIVFAQKQDVAAVRSQVKNFKLGTASDDTLYFKVQKD